MTARPLQMVLRQVSAARRSSSSDGELLAQFVANRDESAFATLVRRHGGLVQSVCRSVLHHHQDTEDAMQAVFLVLARKAASIRKTEALASWLHGVAYRIACKARTQSARRRRSEREAATTSATQQAVDDLSWREVQAVLHAELRRLPDKYRLPLILCCLEGRTRDAPHPLDSSRYLTKGGIWSTSPQPDATCVGVGGAFRAARPKPVRRGGAADWFAAVAYTTSVWPWNNGESPRQPTLHA
jgi:RNA polymerase sigma factor (sigma-70 family)